VRRTRESVEESTKRLFQLDDYTRFRRRALINLVTMYQNGLIDGAKGVTLDIKKMIDTSSKKVSK
jgi:hypothetical protein